MSADTDRNGKISILFDASILGYSLLKRQYRTGIYRVAVSLLRELARRQDVRVAVYTSSGNRELCRIALRREGLRGLPLAGTPVLCDMAFCAMVARNLLMRAGGRGRKPLVWLVRRMTRVSDGIVQLLCGFRRMTERPLLRRVDAYLSPMEAAPSWVRSTGSLSRYIVLHDLIPLLHTQYSIDPADPTRWFPRFLASLRPEDRLLTVSEHTKRDYLALKSAVVPADQITVTYNAVDTALFHPGVESPQSRTVLRRYGIPEDRPVLLSVSTLEPRKRLDAVLRAFGALCRTGARCTLVLCGKNRLHYQSKLVSGIDRQVRSSVVFTGYVPDSDLRVLYCICRAFVYLSEYEGFGLPVLEAMACGAPVIAADRTSLPEVVGEAGCLVDPDDTPAVVEAMRKLLVDDELWRARSDRSLRRAAEFSWQTCAATVVSRMYRDRAASSA